MSLKALLTSELTLGLRIRSVLVQRCYATVAEPVNEEKIDLTSVDTHPRFEDDINLKEDEIAAVRDKSRIRQSQRNVLNNRRPYDDLGPADFHNTSQWKQKMLGRYGIEGSAVDPGFAWPTKQQIAEMQEYERVAYPLSLKEAWAKIEADKQAKAETIRIREEMLAKNLAKTEQWERELNAKIAKKTAEAEAAIMRKERLVEEVRRHFGFKVDPKDSKFKEMLDQKEKQDKKRRKEEKKKEKAARLMAKLMENSSIKGSPSTETNDKSNQQAPPDLA